MANNWAIVIGVNHYDHLPVAEHLNYAVHDAECVKSFLCDQAGFDPDKVLLCSDTSDPIGSRKIPTRPTHSNLIRLLQDEIQDAEAADHLWFFFSGHGMMGSDNHDYLLPSSGYPRNLKDTAISVDFVIRSLINCRARNTVMILDMCRRSAGVKGSDNVGSQTAQAAQQQGIITLFSCRRGEKSYEIPALGQGVFTHALLEGLENSGTLRDLEHYLQQRVPQLNRQYGKPHQVPIVGLLESPSKYDLPLLPNPEKQEGLTKVETLKNRALRAEEAGDLKLAENLWIQILSISSIDQQAIQAIKRIALQAASQEYSSSVTPSQTAGQKDPFSASQASASEAALKHQLAEKKAQVSQRRIQSRHELEMQKLSGELTKIENQHRERQTRYDLEMRCLQAGHQASMSEMNRGETFPRVEGELLLSGESSFEFETVTIDAQGQEIARNWGRSQRFVEDINGVLLETIFIPGGTFLMGSSERKPLPNEQPIHEVTVNPFWMSKYPITKAQWKAIAALPPVTRSLKKLPSRAGSANHPITNISWDEAVEFCDRLSQKTGHQYRLPTEAEWEYACRAGTTTPFHCGATITSDLANYDGTYVYHSEPTGVNQGKPSQVGSFPFANSFGLFDMHGNVWEWCIDHWHENYRCAPTTGEAWLDEIDNLSRVLRGGSWTSEPAGCRSACRQISDANHKSNNTGFRIVRSL